MMASFAFATPPSMPHIAIAAEVIIVSTKDVLLIYGSALMLISIIVAVLSVILLDLHFFKGEIYERLIKSPR